MNSMNQGRFLGGIAGLRNDLFSNNQMTLLIPIFKITCFWRELAQL